MLPSRIGEDRRGVICNKNSEALLNWVGLEPEAHMLDVVDNLNSTKMNKGIVNNNAIDVYYDYYQEKERRKKTNYISNTMLKMVNTEMRKPNNKVNNIIL